MARDRKEPTEESTISEVAKQWVNYHDGCPPCPICDRPMEAPVSATEAYEPDEIERLPLCVEHGYFYHGELYRLEELLLLLQPPQP